MRLKNRVNNMRLASGLLVLVIILTFCLNAMAQDDSTENKLRERRYYYKAFGRRDPFKSLISGEYEEVESDLLDIYSVKLVGVLSGGVEKYAMLEDKNGLGYIVKSGTPIQHGDIVSVGERSVIARVTMFGQTSSVTLRLENDKSKGR